MLLAALQTGENAAGKHSGSVSAALDGMGEVFDFAAGAADMGCGVIVTGEGVNACGLYTDPLPDRVRRYEEMYPILTEKFSALSRHCVLVAGIYTAREGRQYNSALLFDHGRLVGQYDKVHLPADEQGNVTPGESIFTVDTSAGRLGPMICWDMQYPESGRILALMGADLLVCPTWGWEDIFRCRAYENSVPMIAAMGVPESGEIWDCCGPACIVDNMGNILSQGSRREHGIVTAEVELTREPAPQYGSGEITGKSSMRDIRRSQRLPDRYGYLCCPETELDRRYNQS